MRGLRRMLVPAALAASLLLALGPAQAWPGDVDPTFGRDGKVVTAIGDDSYASALVLQPDGKIVAVGTAVENSVSSFALARYRPGGRLDQTFGQGGVVRTTVEPGRTEAYAAALQPDGKILVAGLAATGPHTAILARYEVDGKLDPSFGTDGLVLENDLCPGSRASILLRPDGKIVVVRGSAGCGSNLARYRPDGEPDPAFGAAGKVTVPTVEYRSASLQPEGKIVVLSRNFVISRYLADGSFETRFERIPFNSVWTPLGNAVSIRHDGTLIAAGTLNLNGSTAKIPFVARFYSNGSWDGWFGSGRALRFPNSFHAGEVNAVAVRRDGKIVVGGEGAGRFALGRLTQTGSADTHFGVGGAIRSRTIPGAIFALALQPNERIIAAGEGRYQKRRVFVVARYLNRSYPLDVRRIGRGKGRVIISPPGLRCRSWCTNSFARGTLITLTAKPRSNSRFVRWSADCRGRKPTCYVRVTGSRFVRAVFARRR